MWTFTPGPAPTFAPAGDGAFVQASASEGTLFLMQDEPSALFSFIWTLASGVTPVLAPSRGGARDGAPVQTPAPTPAPLLHINSSFTN